MPVPRTKSTRAGNIGTLIACRRPKKSFSEARSNKTLTLIRIKNPHSASALNLDVFLELKDTINCLIIDAYRIGVVVGVLVAEVVVAQLDVKGIIRQRVASKVDSNFRWQELVDRIQGLFYVFAIRAYNFKWLAKHNSRKKKSTETKPVIDKQVH